MKNKTHKFIKLDFERFFNGKVIAEGNLLLRFPKRSIKKLYVTFQGSFKNNILNLSEHYYEDGKKTLRNWKFKKINQTLFHGSEKNVKGKIIVNIDGNILEMVYLFKIVFWRFSTTVQIKDYMYLVNKNEIINTTYVTKFGINLAKVVLLYKKAS